MNLTDFTFCQEVAPLNHIQNQVHLWGRINVDRIISSNKNKFALRPYLLLATRHALIF